MIENTLTVDRNILPLAVLEWLEAGNEKKGMLSFREENGQIVLERLGNIDPAMMARVQEDMLRFHSTLERLADS